MAQASNYYTAALRQIIADLRGRMGLSLSKRTMTTRSTRNLIQSTLENVSRSSTRRHVADAMILVILSKTALSLRRRRFRVCSNCLAEDHKKKRCPKAKAKVDVCDGCGEPGHMVKGCPHRVCDACGKSGHAAAECAKPEPGPSRKKQKTVPFLDYSSPFLDY